MEFNGYSIQNAYLQAAVKKSNRLYTELCNEDFAPDTICGRECAKVLEAADSLLMLLIDCSAKDRDVIARCAAEQCSVIIFG